MKAVKSAAAVLCAGLLILSLAGCGKQSDRILYRSGLKNYVTLGDYAGITVDTSSEEYAGFYRAEILSDDSSHSLYNELESGVIEEGDIANIDYEGKRDGVAFDGGTDTGYDLEIGSGSFIDGFEDGLIGVSIGETVDLDLTFPENYGNSDLAGAAVVFTVTVNSARRPMEPEESYEALGYATLEEYTAALTERAVRAYLTDRAVANAKIKDYPADDVTVISEAYEAMQDNYYQQQYGVDLETMLSYNGMTLEDFREQMLDTVVHPLMDEQMVCYAILDAEKLGLTDEDEEEQLQQILSEIGSDSVTKEDILEFYGDYYIESLTVAQKAEDFLYEKAVIR